MNINYLSRKIIPTIKSMIDEQIIMCDVNGIIIASTDSSRVGKFHEGAKTVIDSKKQLIITKDLVEKLKGVKTGINLPLFFNRSVVGVIGITGEIDKVKPFGEIVRKMTELLINENYYHEQVEFGHRAVENFIFELLQIKKVNRPLLDRAKMLGIDLEGTKQIILLSINKDSSTVQKEVWHYIKETIPQKDVFIRWGNNRLFWMHSVDCSKQIKADYLKRIQTNCENYFSIKLKIGIGVPADTKDIHSSYEQALTAMNYSAAHSRISYHTDLKLELCLQDISDETKKEFIKRTIGDLIHKKQLLQTLKVFLEEKLSHKTTADRLYIHVNTLHYRLSQIHKLTTLDPKHFTDLVDLYLALIFLEEHTIID